MEDQKCGIIGVILQSTCARSAQAKTCTMPIFSHRHCETLEYTEPDGHSVTNERRNKESRVVMGVPPCATLFSVEAETGMDVPPG